MRLIKAEVIKPQQMDPVMKKYLTGLQCEKYGSKQLAQKCYHEASEMEPDSTMGKLARIREKYLQVKH